MYKHLSRFIFQLSNSFFLQFIYLFHFKHFRPIKNIKFGVIADISECRTTISSMSNIPYSSEEDHIIFNDSVVN